MKKSRLGKTGHMSSIVTFGGFAFWRVSQSEADAAIEMVVERGVNHFDVAPAYGQAELRLGPWMSKNRKGIFLACKTEKRSKDEAWESIQRSLELLHVDYFDLFQFQSVNDLETLNMILGPGGAMEAVIEARRQGLTRYIGITGHRPSVQVEALNRFDFDTVLFPLNRIIAAGRSDYSDYSVLLDQTKKKDVGMIGIKAVAKQPWQSPTHMYRTWYEPFDTQEDIDKSLWFALSQGITTVAMPGDLSLLPMVLEAAERYQLMDIETQKEVSSEVMHLKNIFPMPSL